MLVGDWIGIGGLAISAIVASLGYLRNKSEVRKDEVELLRDENDKLKAEVRELEANLRSLERSKAFWQSAYEDLRTDKHG